MNNVRTVALALLAHPDDAEILCAGTMIRLREEHGWDLHIASCTPGDCGSATLPPQEIAAIRRAEGKTAATFIGATYHCLELRDLKVCFTPEATAAAIDLLRQVNPTLVFTHPRYDYMLDHESCHQLARAASFGFPMPNASSTPLSGSAQVPYLYYVDPLEGLDPYSGELVTPTRTVDITDVIDRKADMLALHASQRDWLRSHHGMDEYLDAMKRHGRRRGEMIGVDYAESFVQHRGHAYPHNDLLATLLP